MDKADLFAGDAELYDRLCAQIKIDQYRLDDELIELPQSILDCAEQAALSLYYRDKAKTALDLATATASDHLRNMLVQDTKGGAKQRSEAQIASEVSLIPEVKDALHTYDHAKYVCAHWSALTDALRAKRDALRSVSDLTISGFLAPNAATTHRRAELKDKRQARQPLNNSHQEH